MTTSLRVRRWRECFALLLIVFGVAACGGGGASLDLAPPPSVTVAVSPGTASLTVGAGTQQFTATVTGATDTSVTWQVNGTTGGNATLGTISSSGLYTPPSSVPSPATVTVAALSVAAPSQSGSATVMLSASAVAVVVSPGTASLTVGAGTQQFTATVTGATDTSVTWQVNGTTGGNATLGTISSSGLYTPPSSVPSPATVTVAALSVAAPSQSGSATVTLSAAASAVAVSVSPASVTLVAGSGQQTFTATVTNATVTSVTWKVNGITGGNSTVGQITTAGVYTAPASVPASGTVTVSAVSVADSSKSVSATVTVTGGVTVSVSPTSASVVLASGTKTFTATVSNSSNTSVLWQVNSVTGGNSTTGTITTGGVYHAPAAPPSPLQVTVTAVSVADTTKSASATVTITVPAPTLTGTATASVVVGTAYDFKPTASDPSGLALTFSSSGKPGWLALNTATGELTGTPAAGDVATSSITLTASNGFTSKSINFSLAVTASANGSATLVWTAPTTATDGSAVTLTGFKIYYGTSAGSLTQSMSVGVVTTALVSNLTTGTPYYFAVTAISSGGESDKTTVFSTTP